MLRRVHPRIFWPAAIGLTVVAACFLAAPLHELLMDLGWMQRHALGSDHDRYFLKVFRRLLLVPLAVVFLWRVRPWRAAHGDYGLKPPRARWGPPLIGFVAVVAVLGGVLVWQFQRGWLRFEDPLRWSEFQLRVGKYILGGFVAGFVEEWFFRGWLTDQLRRRHGRVWLAVLLSSAAYALIHAFRPRGSMDAVPHDAAGAFGALLAWCGHAVTPAYLAAAAGLFCFALLLTAVYRRTGTLWASIGVHAGAVVVLFSYGALTERQATPAWAGTRLLYDGIPVMVLLLFGALRLRPRSGREAGSGESATTSSAGSG